MWQSGAISTSAWRQQSWVDLQPSLPSRAVDLSTLFCLLLWLYLDSLHIANRGGSGYVLQ